MFRKYRATLFRFLALINLLASGLTCALATETNVIHISVEAAQKLISEKKVVVLDIRTPKEFAAGHIAGATNINFGDSQFEKMIGTLDKNQSYLVHCASGNRSIRALPKFEQLEFKSVYHLDGGLRAWQKDGLPVQP